MSLGTVLVIIAGVLFAVAAAPAVWPWVNTDRRVRLIAGALLLLCLATLIPQGVILLR